LPTCCDIAGAAIPESITGSSLLPLLRDPQAPFRSVTCGVIGPHYGVSDGRFRYQWHGGNGDELLFDQHADPGDNHDLSDDPAYAADKARIRAALIEWLRERGDIHIDEQGDLITVPIRTIGEHAVGYTNSPWNNRGWRG